MKFKAAVAVFTLAALSGVVAAQSVLYVNTAAEPGGDGLAWESAYRDLQDALDQAHLPNSPFHEIWVAAGVYHPDRGGMNRADSFNLKSGLMVLGGFAGVEDSRSQRRDWSAHLTVLSGDLAGDDQPGFVGIEENSYHVVMANLVDDTGLLDGFVIQGGNADGSGTYGEGAGLRIEQSDVVVSNCIFRSNISRRGGAAFDLEGDPTFANVVFNANQASESCGALYCTVSDEVDGDDGIHPRVLGCTFVNNISASSERSPLVCISLDEKMLLRNSIFQGNTWLSEDNYNYLPPQFDGAIDWDYICTPQFDAPPYWGGHGAGEDAKLVDADGADDLPGTDDDDLRPLPGSPVIDAGDNTQVYQDRFDLDDDGDKSEPLGYDLGHSGRFYDDLGAPDTGNGTPPLVDVGAFEGPALAVIATASSLDVLEGTHEEFDVRLSRPPASPLTVTIVTAPDGDQDLQPSPAQLTFDVNDWDQPQLVQVSAAEDVDSLDDTATILLTASGAVTAQVAALELDNDLPPGTIFVDAAAVGMNNGLSWTDAFKDLQKALQVAYDSNGAVTQIWVAKGTYRPDQGTKDRARSFALATGLALYGGFAGGEVSLGQRDWDANPTILSGDLKKNDLPGFVNYIDNSYHVVRAADTDGTAVLDGFTVIAGNASVGGGDDQYGAGAYLYAANATFRHCTFASNLAAGHGGGVYIFAAGITEFDGCRFAGNQVQRNGGGLYAEGFINDCDVRLTDCVVDANQAKDLGGGAAIWGDATLTGSTFSGNTLTAQSAKGGGLYLRPEHTPVITGCRFENNDLNTTYQEGGGAFLESGVSYEIHDSVFVGNHAPYGAGLRIYTVGGQTLSMTGCTFTGNVTDQGEGAADLQVNSVITSCAFEGNQGGGLTATGLVQSCSFVANESTGAGGGLLLVQGQVTGCAFFDNIAQLGGGAAAQNVGSFFSDCTFSGNTAQGQLAKGGGLYGQRATDAIRCTFDGNSCTGPGGGAWMYSYDVDYAQMVSCTFTGNSATEGGGWYGAGRAINCSFSGNTAGLGGAISLWSQQNRPTEIRDCSIYGNSADQVGGIYLSHYGLVVSNTILWANAQDGPGGQPAQYGDSGQGDIERSFRYCRVQGWDGSLGGPGNSGDDPLFFNPEGADGVVGTSDDLLNVANGSPCIDAGDSASVPADEFDLDSDDDLAEPLPTELLGTDRFSDDPDTDDTGVGPPPVVDIGCHEFVPQGKLILCYADMNSDGALDLFDFLAFVNLFNIADPAADCDGTGVFDLFDFLCFVNAFNEGC